VKEPAVIYYVALPFTRIDEDGLAPGEAVECTSAAAAVRRADALARRPPNIGAVAFSRQGSPDLGEFEEAIVLGTFGDVPEDIPRTERGN
jgi:hypothetical protein